MELAIIMFFQILFFIIICITFKFKNNIWYILFALSTIIPILGIVVNLAVIVVGLVDALNSYRPDFEIKENKLNKWLYADYFKNKI